MPHAMQSCTDQRLPARWYGYDRCAIVSLVKSVRAPRSLLDATNTVSIGDDQAVADATDRILAQCFGAGSFDRELLHASFTLVGRLFAGEHAGYLACDMPYHDLRHSLDTALVMARLIAGYQSEQGVSPDVLTPEHGLLGVLLSLLHDTGFIRKTSDRKSVV